jgi:hypothetical protein
MHRACVIAFTLTVVALCLIWATGGMGSESKSKLAASGATRAPKLKGSLR